MRGILYFHILSQIEYMLTGLALGSVIFVLASPLLASSSHLEE